MHELHELHVLLVEFKRHVGVDDQMVGAQFGLRPHNFQHGVFNSPRKFTLSELQKLYETILERELDKRNFRKKIQKMDILRDLEEVQQDVAHRAARLFSFHREKYEARTREGWHFEI